MKEKRGDAFSDCHPAVNFFWFAAVIDNHVEQPSGFSGNFVPGSILLCIQTSRLAESIKI